MAGFTAGQSSEWLRGNATIVRPGETLVIRVPSDLTPRQVREYQRSLESAGLPFACLVVPGDELAVVTTPPGERDLTPGERAEIRFKSKSAI